MLDHSEFEDNNAHLCFWPKKCLGTFISLLPPFTHTHDLYVRTSGNPH